MKPSSFRGGGGVITFKSGDHSVRAFWGSISYEIWVIQWEHFVSENWVIYWESIIFFFGGGVINLEQNVKNKKGHSVMAFWKKGGSQCSHTFSSHIQFLGSALKESSVYDWICSRPSMAMAIWKFRRGWGTSKKMGLRGLSHQGHQFWPRGE